HVKHALHIVPELAILTIHRARPSESVSMSPSVQTTLAFSHCQLKPSLCNRINVLNTQSFKHCADFNFVCVFRFSLFLTLLRALHQWIENIAQGAFNLPNKMRHQMSCGLKLIVCRHEPASILIKGGWPWPNKKKSPINTLLLGITEPKWSMI